MKILPTPLDGLKLLETTPHSDARGVFTRLFCEKDLGGVLGSRRIVQINHSLTREKGAVRGLHYQRPPHAEMKLVRCLRGAVWDVAVDLRKGSPTFLKWHAEELTPENGKTMLVPEGFAHGFQALSPDSELLYLHTAFYAPESESGIRHDDARLGIQWPLPATELSARDTGYAPLDASFSGVAL